MAVNGIDSERNYASSLNNTSGTNTTGKVYNAVFSEEDKGDLSVNDFFDMMINQLTNQDFMNPVDDTQYLAQMAQFATMQEMMDLCQYSKQNYAMSMLGKEVTLGKNMIGGSTDTITGVIEKIALVDDEYKIYVDGKPYDLSKVSQISTGNTESNISGTDSDSDSDSNESSALNETQADG